MKDFDTHGGTFVPQGFMQIEAGGTHEENPNELPDGLVILEDAEW